MRAVDGRIAEDAAAAEGRTALPPEWADPTPLPVIVDRYATVGAATTCATSCLSLNYRRSSSPHTPTCVARCIGVDAGSVIRVHAVVIGHVDGRMVQLEPIDPPPARRDRNTVV